MFGFNFNLSFESLLVLKFYHNDQSNAKRQTPNAKLKLSLFFLLFLVITSTFFTCQKERLTIDELEVNIENKSASIKTVSASDIPEVMNFIASKSSDYKFLLDDSTTEEGMNRSHEDNLVMTELITDEITQVTNAYQKSNYTFRLIKQSDIDGKYFLNLVVKEYKDTFYLYIVKYVPDTFWLSTHSITNNLGDFTGHIYYYSDQGIYVANVTMHNGSAIASERHSCYDDSDGGTDITDDYGSGGGGGNDCTITIDWYECGGPNTNIPHPPAGTGTSMDCGTTAGGGSGWDISMFCNTGNRNNLNEALRHPCDGSGGASGGGTQSCTVDPNINCDIPFTIDENCDCVLADEIENDEVAVNTNPLKDGCIKLNAITDNVDVKQKLASLITSSNNNSYEEGFKIVKYQGQIAAGQIENDNSSNAPDCQAVSITAHQQVSTIVHSHPVNCNVFGMFSDKDIMNLAQIAKLYNDGDAIASNNYKDLTIMLAY